MTSSKLKPSFGIDDILYQSPTSSNSIFSKHSDRSAGKSDMDAVGSTTSSHDNSAKLPKHPVPMFPSTMFDFNPAKYYLPHLPMNVHQRFPPSTSYLEQYANALQKASPNLWPFYSHPYNGYFLSGCGFKRKGGQVRFTPQQTQSLERRFANHKYLSPEDRKQLAAQLKLTDRQVKTWFQNRRAKWRRCQPSHSGDEKDHVTPVVPLNLQMNSQLEDLHKHTGSTADTFCFGSMNK